MSDNRKIKFDYLDNKNPYSFDDIDIPVELLAPANTFLPPQITLQEKEAILQISAEKRKAIEANIIFDDNLSNMKVKLLNKQRILRASMISAIKDFKIEPIDKTVSFVEDFYNYKKLKEEFIENKKLYDESEFWHKVELFHKKYN